MGRKTNQEMAAATLQKLIAATKTPVSLKEIQESTGLSKAYLRALILYRYNYIFPCVGVEAREGRGTAQNLYQYKECVIAIEPSTVTQGIVYNMQDSPKYHANMRLLRENRKPLRVFVGGGTLA